MKIRAKPNLVRSLLFLILFSSVPQWHSASTDISLNKDCFSKTRLKPPNNMQLLLFHFLPAFFHPLTTLSYSLVFKIKSRRLDVLQLGPMKSELVSAILTGILLDYYLYC